MPKSCVVGRASPIGKNLTRGPKAATKLNGRQRNHSRPRLWRAPCIQSRSMEATMDIQIINLECVWSVLAGEETVFATPSRQAAVERAMASAKALWEEQRIETA